MNWKKKLAAGTALTTLTAGTIYIINKSVNIIATRNNYLEQEPGNYYEWRFGKIFYTKKGNGSPILLIHSLNPGSSSYEWNKIENSLSKTNTVYSIDLLGCGRSDKPNVTYTSYLYVQLITDFIKHVISCKTDIIVSGESCPSVLLACHADQTIINKVLMVNPPDLKSMTAVPTKRTKILKYLINSPFVGTMLYNILNTRNAIETLFESEYFYDPANVDPHYVDVYFETAHSCNGRGKHLLSCIKGRYTNSSILHCLKSLNNSIFIISGNGNPENKKIADQYKEQLPSIETVVINKTKQMPQFEDSNVFMEHVNILFDLELNES